MARARAGRLPWRGAVRRSLAAGALAAALLVGAPSGVLAHAVLLDRVPAADAVLAAAPAEVVLRFNEPVRPIAAQVLRAENRESVGAGEIVAVDTALHVQLPAGLPEGTYVVSYRVSSADGHPVTGSFLFVVGAADTLASPTLVEADRDDSFWVAAGVAARALHYGTLLLAAGLALFLALLPVPNRLQPPLRRLLAWLALVGLAACIVMLGATGGALNGGPPLVVLTLRPWRVALASPVAGSILAAALGLGLLAAARRKVFRQARSALLAGACLIALSFALSGHAATAGPLWLSVPALTIHALCAAYWVGAFAPLLVALRRLPRTEAHALLAAFSTRAVVAVACLVLAGVVLAALQLGTPAALIATDYGRLLLLKLALVVLLLGLGARNRLVLTPALEQGTEAVRGLRRTIGADLALAAGVVVLTAGLGAVPPPRALAEQTAAHASHGPREYAVHAAASGYHLVLIAMPAAAGENRIDLYLTDPQGQPVGAQAAEMSWTLPEVGITGLRVDANAVEPGHFRARANLPLAGEWQVHADLLVDDFTNLPFQARIVIAR
jgi:copper transport protein